MENALGSILPQAIGVAISPVPIIAVILMLFSKRARSNGPAFLVGWVLALVVVGSIVLVLANLGKISTERYTINSGIRTQAVARTVVPFHVTPPVERPSQRRRRAAHAQMDGDH